MEKNRPSRPAEDLQSLFQPELDERVESGDMVNMEMRKKKVDRLLLRYVTVGLGDPIAGIENEVIFASLDKYRNCVAGGGIEPSIGAKECDLHVYSILAFCIKKKVPGVRESVILWGSSQCR
jgi:hypothetical protein